MAKERSPIKVPSENEDLPDKENAPDFDEDTLRGELGSTLASVTVKSFLFHQFKECRQMWRMMLLHCMTTLKDIWPVMTLFYDYNMLLID